MLKNFIYYILNLSFQNFDAELFSLLKNKKKITIFDIGCFKGVFFKKFYHSKKLINTKKKFYIFDINPNVSKYLENYTNKKDIIYNYIALGKSNKKKKYNFNQSFEASGSSMASLYKDDKSWTKSRELFLKLFLQKTAGYKKIEVPVCTFDSYVKKNKIKNMDIVKIDVDGSEEDVIIGMKNSLKKGLIKSIQLEITDKKSKFQQKQKRLINYLKKNNYYLKNSKKIISVSLLSSLKCTENLFILEKKLT
mgnify:FL=1